jgi:hypothetical protein
VAFETGGMQEGIVAVYPRCAPNPWSGSVVFVLAERARKLPVSVMGKLKIIRALGRNSEVLATEFRVLQSVH